MKRKKRADRLRIHELELELGLRDDPVPAAARALCAPHEGSHALGRIMTYGELMHDLKGRTDRMQREVDEVRRRLGVPR